MDHIVWVLTAPCLEGRALLGEGQEAGIWDWGEVISWFHQTQKLSNNLDSRFNEKTKSHFTLIAIIDFNH